MEGRARGGGGAPRTAMDYTLAALKLFGSQLSGSTTAPSSEGSSPAQMLFGIRFQRAWIQGVIVRAEYSTGDGTLFLDDGSCVTELMLQSEDAKGQSWRPGMYVLVIGAYVSPESLDKLLPVVKVHKIVDLSTQPNREAMWYMEVAEADDFFYATAGSPA
uniref:Uncharacterized protein n=1 Tax=Avena sativa TaxID=4498 RepID=A0ACD6A7T5_AVESA